MELLNNLALGFSVALTLQNVLYCFFGVLLGTLIGVLPGIGPVPTIAMLLPITYALPPVSALIMLAGIYYGASYGGSTTAILVNLPGESSSVVTCLDGYQMARKGQAGKALAVAAIGSFIAGSFATMLIAAFAPPLAEVALKFGPAEYFSLMVLGLIAAVVLASGSLVKALGMIVLGLLLGIVGTDVNSGLQRFSFGIPELSDGIGFVTVAMGVFGFAEIIINLEHKEKREVFTKNVTNLWLKWADFKEALPAILRGTGIGSVLGILPGGGALLSAFASYTVEKKIAKDPSRFGKGAIQGVAGPEIAGTSPAFWTDPLYLEAFRHMRGYSSQEERDTYLIRARRAYIERWSAQPVKLFALKVKALARSLLYGLEGFIWGTESPWSFHSTQRSWPLLLIRFLVMLLYGPVFFGLVVMGLWRHFRRETIFLAIPFVVMVGIGIVAYADHRHLMFSRILLIPLFILGLMDLLKRRAFIGTQSTMSADG